MTHADLYNKIFQKFLHFQTRRAEFDRVWPYSLCDGDEVINGTYQDRGCNRKGIDSGIFLLPYGKLGRNYTATES